MSVNERKTHLAHLDEGVAFLGFKILRNYILIKDGKVEKLKAKLKTATRRNTPVNLEKVIRDINPILCGFVNCYKLANCKKVLRNLMGWLRRRLRAIQMKLWKRPAKLHRRLRQLGYTGDFLKLKMGSWRNAACQQASMAMPNRWFVELGLFQFHEIETGKLPPRHWG